MRVRGMRDHAGMEIVVGSALGAAVVDPVARALVDEFGSLYPRWTVAEAASELTNDLGLPRSWVTVHDGRAIACASLLDDDEVDDEETGPWLGNVWVSPQHRGSGIGSALVEHVVDAARAAGYDDLLLVTDGADDWYAARGWCAERVTTVHGHRMLLMRRGLGD